MRPSCTFPPVTERRPGSHASSSGMRQGIVEEPGAAGQMEQYPYALSLPPPTILFEAFTPEHLCGVLSLATGRSAGMSLVKLRGLHCSLWSSRKRQKNFCNLLIFMN